MDQRDWPQQDPYAAPPADETLCVSCGYPLTGLSPDARCPECGTFVRVSQAQQIDPDTADRILHGLRMTFWLTIVQYAVGFVLVAVFVFIALRQGGQMSQSLNMTIGAASGGFGVVMMLLIAFAWFRTSTVLPGCAPDRDAPRLRNALRFGLILLVVFQAIATANNILNPTPVPGQNQFGQSPTLAQIYPLHGVIIAVLAYIVNVTVYTLQALYFRWLGRQIAGANIERFASTCTWLVPVLLTAGIILCGLGPTGAVVLLLILNAMLIGPMKRLAQPGLARAY